MPFILEVAGFNAGGPAEDFTKNTVANLKMWYRADKDVGLSGSGVNTWADQSGFSDILLQGTDSRRPTLVSGVIAGNPALLFNGSTAWIGKEPITTAITGAHTEFYVIRPVVWSTGARQGLLSSRADTQSSGKESGSAKLFLYSGASLLGDTISAGNNYILTYGQATNTTDSFTRVNASAAITGSSGTTAEISGNTYFGAVGNSLWYNGYIAEILIYSGLLTANEQQTVRDYLNDKYKVY